MVSNEEIRKKLENIRKDDIDAQGYLECEKCGGYYELQPRESPGDFEECHCGGKLRYYNSLSGYGNENINQKSPYGLIKIIFIILAILLIFGIIGIIITYIYELHKYGIF